MNNAHKMGKHFILTMKEGPFSFTRNEESIAEEEALNGIYV